MTTATEEAAVATPPPKNRGRINLSQLVLISLVLGALTGLFFGEMVAWMRVVGDIFIKLLQIAVIPYVSVSLILGLGGLTIDKIKELSVKGGAVLLGVWGITLLIVVLAPLSFPAWPSSSFFSVSLAEDAKSLDFLRLFIPFNPFNAFANAIVPAIVVFCVLIGLALSGTQNKEKVLVPLEVGQKVLMTVNGYVAKLAPIGVFSLIASAIGTIDYTDLARLQVFIVLYALLALVLSLWVLPGLIATLTPLRQKEVLEALRTPLITAFATGSSLIVLPQLIEQSQKLLTEMRNLDAGKKGEAGNAVEVLIPTFYPFPSPGVLFALMFVLFAGWYIGADVPLSSYASLLVVGIPSLFGGTLLALPPLLDMLSLPSDLLAVFVSVDVINSRFGTLLAAMHYATIGLIGTVAMVGGLQVRLLPLVRHLIVSLLLVGGVFLGVYSLYSYVIIAPYTKDDALRGMQLSITPQPATIHPEVTPASAEAETPMPTLRQIEDRGVLRVCYQPNEYPSAFLNTQDPPQLVGFDVEMAHRLAVKIGASIDFFPAKNEKQAKILLDTRTCDVYMRTLPITAFRTTQFAMTSHVFESSVGLLVEDSRRDDLQTWDLIKQNQAELTLGIEDVGASIRQLAAVFPEATLVPIDDMDKQRRLLESGLQALDPEKGLIQLDGVFDMSEEAAAWSVLYPSYKLVVPKPTVRQPVGYAVAHGNNRLLTSLNAWLYAERATGSINRLYEHWMLGGAIKQTAAPRWSVIRDVLGWVD